MCSTSKRLLLGLLVVLGLAIPAQAQVAFDGETVQTYASGSTVTSIPINSKTTAGSNRLGVVGCVVSVHDNVNAADGGALWGATSMGVPRIDIENATDGRGVFIWVLANPPTAATSITIDADTGGGVTAVCSARSYSGVDQTTPVSNTNTASGTADPATVTCTTGGANDMLDDEIYFIGAGTPPSEQAGQTLNSSGDQGSWFGASSRQDGADGGVMSWGLTSPTRWSIGCINLAAASAGVAGPPQQNLMLIRGDELVEYTSMELLPEYSHENTTRHTAASPGAGWAGQRRQPLRQ